MVTPVDIAVSVLDLAREISPKPEAPNPSTSTYVLPSFISKPFN
jgi:hypothetical protein